MKIFFFMKKIIILILFFFTIPNQTVSSQEVKKHSILTDKYHVGIGVFIPQKNVKIGANGQSTNQEIDFGKSFHFKDHEASLFTTFQWNFSKKWNFSTEYFSIHNSWKAELEQDIQWNDYTFKTGANIKAGFEMDLYRIFFGRIFSQGMQHEFGVGIGLHALDIGSYIEGDAYINESEFGFKNSNISVILPLPNIGAWYFYAPNSKLALTAIIDVFSISISEYHVSLWNISSGINYQIFKHISLGYNYRYFKVIGKVNKGNWDGRLNVIFKGSLFTISGNF